MTVLTRMREMLQPAPAIELDELFPKTLLLDVTPGDCERGVRRDDYRCVAARATARRFDGADVRVGSGWIDVTYAGRIITYLVPRELRVQILGFDAGRSFAPGTYALRRYDSR